MTIRAASNRSSEAWLSPLRLGLLAVHAVCLGALLVLMVTGTPSPLVVLLTIGVGLAFAAGLTGALLAARRRRQRLAEGD